MNISEEKNKIIAEMETIANELNALEETKQKLMKKLLNLEGVSKFLIQKEKEEEVHGQSTSTTTSN